jgi:hypothetical protein
MSKMSEGLTSGRGACKENLVNAKLINPLRYMALSLLEPGLRGGQDEASGEI